MLREPPVTLLQRLARGALVALAAVVLAGCGIKGPLRAPPGAPPGATPPPPPPGVELPSASERLE